MIDDRSIEIAYVILAAVAWVWAGSQLRIAFGHGGGWRWTVAVWLTAKAAFFTVAASIWWFNTLNEHLLEAAIYVLTAVHVIAFVHWIRLEDRPSMTPPDAPPSTVSGLRPREEKWRWDN